LSDKPTIYIISRMKDKKKERRQKPALSEVEGTGDRRQKSFLCPLSSVLCILILSGCAKQQQYETIEQINVPDIDKAEAMQIAEDVLAKMHFKIEKADYESGIIRTKPLPGAQLFELWRKDNVGGYNTAEANLHSIRKIVHFYITEKDTRLSIDCNVQVQRLTMEPGKHAGSSILGWEPGLLKRTTGVTWTDLGKDAKLATEILKRIQKRIVTSKNSTKLTTKDTKLTK
jgi:hypothetical protein